MYQWITGNAHALIVTLNDNNITLNQNAASYFNDVRYCLIGIDPKTLKVAIKPVSKADIESNRVVLDQLHKISLGKGYAKISNKAVCDYLASLIHKPLHGIKLMAHFNDVEKMLEFDLNTILEKGEETWIR